MITQRRKDRILEILNYKQKDLEIFLDDVYNSQNISAIIRSCDGVGVLNFYFSDHLNREFKKHKTITQGSHKWLNIKKILYDKRVSFLKEKQKNGFQIVVTNLSQNSKSYKEIDYTKPTIIVVGNEVEGVSKEVLDIADEQIIIPMYGMAQSLNVSVATALILFEASYQREQAGFYKKPTLSKDEIEYFYNQWIAREIDKKLKKH